MKKGFTLAEVLITLAVIGIVASMTIPGLMQSTNNEELKVAWRKKFAEISQIQLKLMTNNEIPFTDSEDIYNIFKTNLNVMNSSTTKSLWHADNKWFNIYGEPSTSNLNYTNSFVLSDGSYIVRILNQPCSSSSYTYYAGGTYWCSQFLVDVNGAKGPNKTGSDIFGLEIRNDKVYAFGGQGSTISGANCGATAHATGSGSECSAKALQGIAY